MKQPTPTTNTGGMPEHRNRNLSHRRRGSEAQGQSAEGGEGRDNDVPYQAIRAGRPSSDSAALNPAGDAGRRISWQIPGNRSATSRQPGRAGKDDPNQLSENQRDEGIAAMRMDQRSRPSALRETARSSPRLATE